MSVRIDPRNLTSELEKALSILANQSQNGNQWLGANEISRLLRDDFGVHVHWKTIHSILEKNKSLVTRRKRDHKWQYSLLENGKNLITKPKNPIILIDPSKALESVIVLHDLLSNLSGTIRLCDPYLDATTLEHLDSCSSGVSVQLLTHNVKDSGKLRQLVGAFSSSGRSIEIKVTSKPVLHDRYIIDDKGMLILGTSLNGFGKKECFLIKSGQDIRLIVLESFKEHWKTANLWS